MTIPQALDLAKECGLTTLGEAFDHVRYHSTSLFKHEDISKEINELADALFSEAMRAIGWDTNKDILNKERHTWFNQYLDTTTIEDYERAGHGVYPSNGADPQTGH